MSTSQHVTLMWAHSLCLNMPLLGVTFRTVGIATLTLCVMTPRCSLSPGLLDLDTPSSPGSSFGPGLRRRPAVAAVHGHNTRITAASFAECAASDTPLPRHPATIMVPHRQQQEHIAQRQAQRKIGRPIEFTGDIDSADLTDADRRRLKR